jgi:hypothetical protein
MGLYVAMWGYMSLHVAIWATCGCMRLYGVLGCIGLYWAIWLYMGLYGAIYRAIWGYTGRYVLCLSRHCWRRDIFFVPANLVISHSWCNAIREPWSPPSRVVCDNLKKTGQYVWSRLTKSSFDASFHTKSSVFSCTVADHSRVGPIIDTHISKNYHFGPQCKQNT